MFKSISPVLRLTIALVLICAGPLFAQTAEPLILSPERGQYNLVPYMESLEDPQKNLTFQDISSEAFSGRFSRVKGRAVILNFTESAWWFRFRLSQNPTNREDRPGPERLGAEGFETWFLELGKPGIKKIDLYIPVRTERSPSGTDSKGWLTKKAGSDRSHIPQDIMFRMTVFKLPDSFRDNAYFYLRMESSIALNMNVTVRSAEAFINRAIPDVYGFGVIYGILISMICYNLIIFFVLRDRVYLFYCLYIIGMLIYSSFLYGHVQCLNILPEGAHARLWWFAVWAATFFGLVFAKSFLDTKKNAPTLNRVLVVFLFLATAVPTLALIGFPWLANVILNFLSFLGSLAVLISAIVCAIRGFLPARYFLIAWSVLLIGVVLYSTGGSIIERSFAAVYTFAIGSALESILLSFALADRIRVLKMERAVLEIESLRLEELSVKDELTKLHNRRYGLERLKDEIERARRLNQDLSLLILDVDDFKDYNDAYGHPEGDRVLVQLARAIEKGVRESDVSCRYGGEEFLIILPGAGASNAHTVAEKIRKRFAATVFKPRSETVVSKTVSLGVAQLKPKEAEEDLIRRADEALYMAKSSGKNQTCVGD